MSDKFKPGEKVVLKSGGPVMTVHSFVINEAPVGYKQSYRCQWFAGKKLESGFFKEESLEIYTPKQ